MCQLMSKTIKDTNIEPPYLIELKKKIDEEYIESVKDPFCSSNNIDIQVINN